MSESMVERVARALFAKLADDPDWDDAYETREQAQACDHDDISQQECFELARAAIEAIREPTEEMQLAGATQNVEVAYTADGRGRCLTAAIPYRAMIDAALKEGGE